MIGIHTRPAMQTILLSSIMRYNFINITNSKTQVFVIIQCRH